MGSAATSAPASQSKKRTFMFDVSPGEKQQPTKKVAFCDRIPSLPKIPDPIEGEDKANARAAFVNVVNGLWRHWHLCTAAQTWLDNRLQSVDKPKGDGFFSSPPGFLKQLDQEYLASFLVKHSKITMKSLEAVSVYDPESPMQLLCFALRCNVHLKLPECLVDKELMGATLLQLMDVGGLRLKDMTDELMLTGGGGGIAWPRCGCYDFEWNDNGMALRVLHRPTKDSAEVPPHSPIHKSFALLRNWSDYEAAVHKKPVTLVLHALFDEHKGPHKHKVLTASAELFETAVKKAKKAQEDRKQATRPEAAGEGFKAAHKRQAKQDSIQKARQAYKTKQDDLKTKRSVKMDGAK